MNDYISTVKFRYQFVDCRFLNLNLRFYDLTEESVRELANLCFDYLQILFNKSFVRRWAFGNRDTKEDKIVSKMQEPIPYELYFAVDGMVVSDIIYNRRTFNAYCKNYNCSNNMNCSADYIDYFKELFEGKEPRNCKDAVNSIFHEKGKLYKNIPSMNDFSSSFSAKRYITKREKFHGEFHINIYFFCLGTHGDEISKSFSQFSCHIAEKFKNISARISLSPIDSRGFGTDYTNYFGLRHGNYGRIDESEFLSDNKFVYKDYISHICHTEWGRDYYCLGAEWFNIISPLQQVHLPTLLEDAKIYPQISTKKLSGGGIAVHLKKEISKIDIDDFVSIKKLLYNALFPGCGRLYFYNLYNLDFLSYLTKPRQKWDYVPIFDDEIFIEYNCILFKHRNCTCEKDNFT